jgi:aminoglycoside phosphotransferase (APT) family kinase protein
MSETKVYSQRLGRISDAQFAAVAERFNLGAFLSAAPTTSGLFGQNVFVTTTKGEFVLRGAPHWVKRPLEKAYRPEDRLQFTQEKYFAHQLHEQTEAPVPWPMLHDEASDIFGWPYLVMPKMPGACFNERDILKVLSAEDRRSVAHALGATLAEMQKLTSPFAGNFDVDTISLTPFAGGNTQHVIDEIQGAVSGAETEGILTPDDIAWIAAAEDRARGCGARANTYVHCDYKLNNLTLSKSNDEWRVTGLFDLHEAKFGDGGLDIVRQACSYLDTERGLARVFVDSYFERVARDPRLQELMPLYIINDRMKFWAFFARPENRAAWTVGKTFRQWAGRYSDAIVALL